jgi:hypothetical protein
VPSIDTGNNSNDEVAGTGGEHKVKVKRNSHCVGLQQAWALNRSAKQWKDGKLVRRLQWSAHIVGETKLHLWLTEQNTTLFEQYIALVAKTSLDQRVVQDSSAYSA